MRRIALDVNSVVPFFIQGWTTGIGRTTLELVQAMDQLENLPVEVVLFSQNMKGSGARNLGTHFKARHLFLPFRDKWNRLLSYTPTREWLTGCDLFHIPHNFDHVHHPEKTILTLHDALFFVHPEEKLNHSFAQKHYPKLARRCKHIITCSQSSKRDIMQYMDIPEEKITVIPWGVNNVIFHPAIPAENKRRYFLSVSCSAGRKNTMAVVRAFAQFASGNHPEHRLILVWDNPSEETLIFIQRQHIVPLVDIIPSVDNQQLADLYAHATATFFPSRYEGFGLPVLESMACGTPVVTCPNSALPEVGGDAALYVLPDDIDSMARLMESFENASANLVLLREKCLRQASRFSWLRCAQETINCYTCSL
ncbi:MAG: glycosyltransferase family 1 protein [Bacteroidales bacterium]|nr:glycosyltransferase family 1 protein [Bacteroidales bacterium]